MASSRDVQGHLEQVAAGKNTGQQKLTFDPTTGILQVMNSTRVNRDNVVCTDMAAAGFFTNFLALDLNLLF